MRDIYDTSKKRSYSYGGEISAVQKEIDSINFPKKQKRKDTSKKIVQPAEEQVRCPKCGSTQIQVLRKKWSPLTGIFTNKVERVCVNCKKRF